MSTTPTHLLPTSCYICGAASDSAGAHFRNLGGHGFWSNADAAAHFAAEDRRRTVVYSTGETTAEGQFVATTRGR